MSRSADNDPAGSGAEPSRARPGGEAARTEGDGRARSLAEVVGAGGGLPEDAVLWIAAGLAGALGVLHQAGRAHGDLRAGNVLLTRGGPRLTGDGPGRSAGAPVPAADMIALGMLLVAAYTGVSGRRPDLDQLPVRLRQVVAVCLAEDPRERATPAQLLALIRTLETDAPVWTVEADGLVTPADGHAGTAPPSDTPPTGAPPPDTPVEAPPRPGPRGLSGARLVLVIVAALLVGVVVTAVLLLVPGRDGGTAGAPVTSRPTVLRPSGDTTPRQTPSQQGPSRQPTPATSPATHPATRPATPTGPPPPAPTPRRTRQAGAIDDCSGKPLTEPVSLLLFCGDGGATLHDLIWTDWGSATATARGMVSEHSCRPDCATGGEVDSAATVIVSGLSGGRYTLMEIRAPRSPSNPDAHFTLDRLGPTYQN